MQRINKRRDERPEITVENVPCLGGLRLSSEDLTALGRQGFVARERRGRRTYYKLRFRRGRRQQVRYLGSDPARAVAVESALDQLRQERQRELRLARLARAARRTMRESKRILAPLLEVEGLRFHGYAIRCRRRRGPHQATSAPRGAK